MITGVYTVLGIMSWSKGKAWQVKQVAGVFTQVRSYWDMIMYEIKIRKPKHTHTTDKEQKTLVFNNIKKLIFENYPNLKEEDFST